MGSKKELTIERQDIKTTMIQDNQNQAKDQNQINGQNQIKGLNKINESDIEEEVSYVITDKVVDVWLGTKDGASQAYRKNLSKEQWKKMGDNKMMIKKREMCGLVTMLILTSSYFIVELVFGVSIGSLALIADAIHMLSDMIALIVGVYVTQTSNKTKTTIATYGWRRMEVVGGLINSVMLMAFAFTIITEAIQRFFVGPPNGLITHSQTIIIVACVGLGVNLVGLFIFGHQHSHNHSHNHAHNHSKPTKMNHNIKAVMLHVIGDALGSLGVIASGVIITYTTFEMRLLADPISSLFISLLILYGSLRMVTINVKVLLQQVPDNINTDNIQKELLKMQEILAIHEFHVWQLNISTIIGTLHYCVNTNISGEELMKLSHRIRIKLHMFGIHSTVVQPEYIDFEDGSNSEGCYEPICQENIEDCVSHYCCGP